MDKIYITFDDILLILISLIIPPLPVVFKRGCGTDFCINLLLTLLTGILGIVHAIYIILVTDKEEYSRLDEQNGTDNNRTTNIPENAIVLILPGANVNTNSNTIPNNLPPPSYAESEQLAKEQNELLYPDLPKYEATSSNNNNNEQPNEKH